jgi:hypothetical protein
MGGQVNFERKIMAIIHKAYSFDLQKFQALVTGCVFIDTHLDSIQLLELARKVVANASTVTNQSLRDLRFDSEWLNSGEDIARTYLWYLIVLAGELSPVASLSTRYMGSYTVLQAILPLAGWSNSEMQKLISGSPLCTLPEALRHDFLDAERNALDQFGGWLSLGEIKVLKEHLENSRSYFSSSFTESIDALRKADNAVSAVNSLSPEERMEKAYKDGIDMLQEAINKEGALLSILD